jgi:DNA helicase-2/ATP-dependent DNA helicase PcrA
MVSSAREFELEYDPDADPAADATQRGGTSAPQQTDADPLDDAPFDAGLHNPQSTIHNPQSPPRMLMLLRAYLESVALVADADAVDPAQGSITLMTLHAAKGLEFKAVAMIGLEEGLLPHTRALDSEADMEEERRLCFVGITRAMRRLLMTSAKYRTIRGLQERTIPSRFLGELPHDTLEVSDQSDTFGGLGEEWGERPTRSESFDIPGQSNRTLGAPRRHSTPAPGSAGEFSVGMQVRHPQFGIGTIKSVQSGANARATIQFRDVGTKTLVLEYARLTRVS